MLTFLLEPYSLVPLTLAISLLSVWFFRSLILHQSSPPGPRPWPVVGNLDLIGPLPHKSLQKLSETYGPLMQLKFGTRNVLVANSPDMAKEVLKTHDRNFSYRLQLAAGKYTNYNYSGVATSHGPNWHYGKKIFISRLLNAKRLESYEYIRVEERMEFLKRLHVLKGKQVCFRDHLSHLVVSVMSRTVLGKMLSSDTSHQNVVIMSELCEMIDELFEVVTVFVIGDWMPFLAWFDFQQNVKRMKKLSAKIDKMLEFIIKEHRNARNGVQEDGLKDMLDILIDLADDPKSEVKLTDNNVKAFTLDLLAGGTETTTISIEWAMADLMKNPEKMKKAKEELDTIIGQERWVEEKDIQNLPYLDAVTKESMRLHPTSSLLPPHMSSEDCNIKQYHVPKGTIVLINIWSIGRDATLWDSPDEFQPERFLNCDIDVKGQSFKLLPFGSGRRMCPAYSLGLKMIKSTLANLIHGFNWSLPKDTMAEYLDMDEIHGLTTKMKHPLVAVADPCLPPHLYTSPCQP